MLHLPINKTALNLKSLPLQRTGAETHRIQTYPVFVKSKALHIPGSVSVLVNSKKTPVQVSAEQAEPAYSILPHPVSPCTHAPIHTRRCSHDGNEGGKQQKGCLWKRQLSLRPAGLVGGKNNVRQEKFALVWGKRGGGKEKSVCMGEWVCVQTCVTKRGRSTMGWGQLPPPQNHLCASDSTESVGLIWFLAQRRVCSGFLYIFFNHQCWIVLNTLLCNCPTTTAMAL